MTTLLIATANAHKVLEIGQILGPEFRYLTLKDFPGAPPVVEDAGTFAGNATKKVLSLAEWVAKHPDLAAAKRAGEAALFVVADDSGLEVDALNGAPGIHSARFAAGDAPGAVNTPDAANNAKLLHLLETEPLERRTGRFRCVLAVLRMNFSLVTGRALPHSRDEVVIFQGVCEGSISRSATGRGGFGYDPLFVPTGLVQSFAELSGEKKNQLSHRARALAKLKPFLAGKPA